MTTDYKKIKSAASKLSWGFLLLILDIYISYFNITPSFLSYYFFSRAIELLSGEERELKLIHRMSSALFWYKFIMWGVNIAAAALELDMSFLIPISLIFSVTNIYFQFQLLTNTATVAKKCLPEAHHEKRIIICRDLQVISLTLLTVGNLTSYMFDYNFKNVLIILAVINCISVLCCVIILAVFGSSLPEEKTNP